MKTKLYLILFSLLLLEGCTMRHCSMKEFHVTYVTPNDLSKMDANNPSFELGFSGDVYRSSVEKNITFKLDGEEKAIPEDLFWLSSSRVKVKLGDKLIEGKTYVLKVENLESVDGNDVKPFEKRFSVGKPSGGFTLESHSPLDKGKIAVKDGVITLTFSQMVSMRELVKNVTISPNVDFVVKGNEESKTFELHLKNSLLPTVEYVCNIHKELHSVKQYQIDKAKSFSFMSDANVDDLLIDKVEMASSKVVLTEHLKNHGVEKNDVLKITFNKDIDIDSVNSGVVISNGIQGIADYDVPGNKKIVKFITRKAFEIGKTYDITIRSNVMDINKIPLREDHVYQMVIDGANSQPLTVTSVEIKGNAATYTSANMNAKNIILASNLLIKGTDKTLDVRLTFSSDITLANLVRNISLSTSLGVRIFDITQPNVADNKVFVVTLVLDSTFGNEYTLILGDGQSGLLDASGNYLKSAFNFTLGFNYR